jgi:hypothetical protein
MAMYHFIARIGDCRGNSLNVPVRPVAAPRGVKACWWISIASVMLKASNPTACLRSMVLSKNPRPACTAARPRRSGRTKCVAFAGP